MQFKHLFSTLIVLFNFWVPCFAQEPTVLEHGGAVSSVAFSPVNPALLASAGGQNTVKVWNLRNSTVKTLKGHTEVVNSVAFSPDGKWLVSGSEDATLKVWDISRWQNIETRKPMTFRMPSPIPQVAFSPVEPLLATAGGGVQLLDIGNQIEVATFEPDEWTWTLAFSGDGAYLATTQHGAATVKIWDIQEKQIMTTLEGPTEDMNAVKFSPDTGILAASSWDGEIKLWSAPNWEPLGTLQTDVVAVDFSPDGKLLASAGWETVTLWSVENGENIATLTGHTGGEWIRGIAFSPDGRTLATGGGDGTVHIWDIDAYLQSQQQAGIVRLIYFLPSDRTPQPDIDAKMDMLIKEVQLAYAEIMERHGFGRKTFEYETDANGKAVVHHVKGKFKDSYYDVEARRVWEEIYEQFDTFSNIYLTALDIKSEIFKRGEACGLGGETGSHSGTALLPASGDCFNVDVAAHELGHAFGLKHDYRTNPKLILSSHTADRMIRSFCAAEWLDAHSYLNTHEPGFNEPTTIEMQPPQAVPPNDIRLRFEVTDPDGLHQAQLITSEFEESGGLTACKRLNGTSSRVEFVITKEMLEHSNEVILQIIDQHGDFSWEHFNLYTNPQAGSKIEGPWLWMIVPTREIDGRAAATSGTDYLAEVSGGAITEKQVATKGATASEAVGNKVWTPAKIAVTGPDNIGELVNAIGFGEGDINNHVAYGSLALEAPRIQKTKMHVGSDDAIKVWLNGVLVHDNPVNRPARDYQENFPVTLKQGTNILLVAVYEGQGNWSGFFGFDKDTNYTLTLPTAEAARPAWDVNEDGITDATDAALVTAALGQKQPKNSRLDVNGDGVVDGKDLALVAEHLGEGNAPAASYLDRNVGNRSSLLPVRELPLGFTLENVERTLNILRAADDGTLTFKRGIANLEALLALFVPENTTLLHNYPNPFNPETWIPYQLATPADVTLTIYAVNGTVVRTLDLGHQPAGMYQNRSRAAYWDGRNAMGESVASGVYFYTLTAGDFTATRKLLICK